MAYEETQRRISLDAASSVALATGIPGMVGAASPNYGHMFAFVKISGAHACGLCTAAANERPLGILQNKPQKVGEACEIAISGNSLLICGTGGLAAGNAVKLDASGHGIAATLPDDIALVVADCIEAGVAGSVATVSIAVGR